MVRPIRNEPIQPTRHTQPNVAEPLKKIKNKTKKVAEQLVLPSSSPTKKHHYSKNIETNPHIATVAKRISGE